MKSGTTSFFVSALLSGLFFCADANAQANRVTNFSFEVQGSTILQAEGWQTEYGSYERYRVLFGGWDGEYALKLVSPGDSTSLSSAKQRISFEQTTAVPVLLTVRVKGAQIVDNAGDKYGAVLYCRVRYQSGETDYCPTTNKTKNVGTFDWRYIGINTGTMLRGHLPIKWIEVVPLLGPLGGTAWFDDIQVKEYHPGSFSGAVTIMPDDGFKEHYSFLFPAMSQHAWRGTIAIVSNYLGSGDPAYMNLDELYHMRNSGWEIASHSVDHSNLSILTPTQTEDQFYWSKRFLTEKGFEVKSFVLPFGEYNAFVLGLNAERGYYSSVRKVERGYNPMGAFPLDIKVQELKSTTTDSEVALWLQQAKERKAWLVILLHKIRMQCPDQYCNSPQLLQNTLGAIKTSGLPVVTYEEGLNLVRSPR